MCIETNPNSNPEQHRRDDIKRHSSGTKLDNRHRPLLYDIRITGCFHVATTIIETF